MTNGTPTKPRRRGDTALERVPPSVRRRIVEPALRLYERDPRAFAALAELVRKLVER